MFTDGSILAHKKHGWMANANARNACELSQQRPHAHKHTYISTTKLVNTKLSELKFVFTHRLSRMNINSVDSTHSS